MRARCRIGGNVRISNDEVRRLFGDIDDHLIVEIIESGASLAELEAVAASLAGQSDAMTLQQHLLAGTSLRIFNLLQQADEQWEEDR